jgi:hypothetical protein
VDLIERGELRDYNEEGAQKRGEHDRGGGGSVALQSV